MSFTTMVIVGSAEALLLMLLGWLAVVFYRLDPPDVRRRHFFGLMLKLAGILLIGLGFLLDLLARSVLPLLVPDSALQQPLQSLAGDLELPLMLAGFFLFCTGLLRLLRVLRPERLQSMEEELRLHKLLEREMETRSQGLELLYRSRNLELARTEEAARLAHNIAAMTLQNMNQGLIMVDTHGEVLVYNHGFLEFTGLSAEEAEQCKTFEDFVRQAHTAPTPHDPDQVVARSRQGGVYSYEVALGNGKVYDVRQTALDKGGFIRTYTDISARKQMEQELRQSRDAAQSASELMNTTMQNMDQGILMVDASHRIVMFNEKVLDLLRKDRAQVHPNLSLEEFFRLGEVDASSVERALRVARSGEKAYYELDTLDGTTLAVRQNPLQDGGWVRTYTDITEQKKVEAALRQSKSVAESTSAIMETTLQNMGQGILMVDAQGRIVTCNDKLLEYLGLDKSQVAACETFADFVELGQVPAYFKEKARQLAEAGGVVSYELPFFSGRILQVTQNPLKEGGWVRTYSDITARKKIEQEMQRAMVDAEASSQAKAAFLATMSHEIRTPMNGIIGMVDLLSQSRLNEDQTQVVRTIRDSGHALLTILDDILDLSKIEAGKLQLELVEMSIRDTVEGAAATLSAFAARNAIQLITYIDPDIGDRVYGDPVRIRQIIFNLLSNAIKFSRKGSEVLVRVDPVTASDDGDEKAVCFTVTDHGVGIPMAAQANLFESFIQAETSTTRRYGGTGLGLAICKRLTTMMHGSIKFRSVEGEGTTFFIDLKFRPLPARATAAADNSTALAGLTVLLAGDSEMQCSAAATYLENAGASVLPTLDMEELPQLLQEVRERRGAAGGIALVLLDSSDKQRYRRVYQRLAAGSEPLPPILLAQSSGMLQDSTEKLGRELLLEINPLRRDKLVRLVAIASGRASPDSGEHFALDDVTDIPLHTVQEALEAGSLVLVAEDNSINQDVIRRQLNRLGYQCELAATGREALQLWRTRPYAVLLTDCHMPEMDGFDLTRAIRTEEARTPRKRTPIIAITANALKGEAERCLAAGMDDYLAKPLKLKSLQELLQKWMVNSPVTRKAGGSLEASFRRQLQLRNGERSTAPAVSPELPVLDERAIKDELGEDPALFRDIMGEFRRSLEGELHELEQASRAQDMDQVLAAAHKLKSGCRTAGAMRLAQLCETLELAARKRDWPTIEAGMLQLPQRAREVLDCLQCYEQPVAGDS